MATYQFNVVKSILQKSIFDENVIHIILTAYWKNLKNKYKDLVDWINIDKLNWEQLSSNPNAIYLLEIRNEFENCLSIKAYNNLRDKICWDNLSLNPNAIELLTNNQHKIDWERLSSNPNAIELLTNNQDKIDWESLSANPNAIHLLKNNVDEIDWYYLSVNPSIFEDEPMPIV